MGMSKIAMTVSGVFFVTFYSICGILHMCYVLLQYNSLFETAVSVDTSGMLEYWTGPKNDYVFPRTVDWEFKTDTDLYEFAKVATQQFLLFTCL